jgi:hypothetical protein
MNFRQAFPRLKRSKHVLLAVILVLACAAGALVSGEAASTKHATRSAKDARAEPGKPGTTAAAPAAASPGETTPRDANADADTLGLQLD